MKRSLILLIALVAGPAIFLAGLILLGRSEPVKVGVLTSATGTMADSEQGVAAALRLAFRTLNQRGGVLGTPVAVLEVDGASDPGQFARVAERLIEDEGVVALFGCWTSASRKNVRPVVERHDHLLFYPVQYEGLEDSRHIVYLGAAPNQQVIPAVKWSVDHLGTRAFLIGSDYIFPRAANVIISEMLELLGAEVVGEEYLLLGESDATHVVERILESRPDFILNTLNGDSNAAFFEALRAAGIRSDEIPVMSFSFGERELQQWNPELMEGDYLAWNYFMSLENPENADFVDAFQMIYGVDERITDPMETAYASVFLWAQAVEAAGSFDPVEVRSNLPHQSFRAPGGIYYIDPETLHTWKTVRIGRIGEDGQVTEVWNSGRPVRPVPFPILKERGEWRALLDELQREWDGQWQAPPPELEEPS